MGLADKTAQDCARRVGIPNSLSCEAAGSHKQLQIALHMLEIGTYHFTYRKDCRVCCAVVLFLMLYTLERICYDENESDEGTWILTGKAGDYMPSAADIIRDSVIEFSRLQDWMIPVRETNPDVYDSMHKRYMELKVTLSSLGVNFTEIDRIKE